MKKVLFLDRDGTLIQESPDQMLNELFKFRFLPGMLSNLSKIAKEMDYILVMVTNQDGLGTASYPEKEFWPLQEFLLDTLEGERIFFDNILIDTHFPEDEHPNRKPGTGMLRKYSADQYDFENSFVIGDRYSDMELAKNLNCHGILLHSAYSVVPANSAEINPFIQLRCENWKQIYKFLSQNERRSKCMRSTSETSITASINLDGNGTSDIATGLAFFDHMLTQIAKHGSIDLFISCQGDLDVDEHHTIEDTAIVLGDLFQKAIGKKAGMERYGFSLPMDDCLSQVSLDFGGRSWLVWDVSFNRESVGDMPTEMFYHFFKSFSDHANCNLNIKADGQNEHHKIESIFKSFARAIKMAVKRDLQNMDIPSTKGVL